MVEIKKHAQAETNTLNR